MQNNILKFIIILCVLIAFSPSFVFAVPPVGGYEAGQILNPDCAPGDVDCIVKTLVVQDEGVDLSGNVLKLNFEGAGVSSGISSGVVTVTIPGSSGGITSLNGVTASTQTFEIGTAGTSPSWSSPVGPSASVAHILNLPISSGANTGILSAADWTTFNDKQPALALYRENPSSATTPTVTGANAIAIGNTSVANGVDAISIGTNTSAVGNQAFSYGYEANATSYESMALGYNVLASAQAALAVGRNTEAYSTASLAVGSNASASGNHSTAVGSFAEANSLYASAYGSTSQALSSYATAIGYSATVNASSGTALGLLATVNGTRGIAIGSGSIATARDSMAIGSGVESVSINETSFGYFPTEYTPQGTTAVDADDRAFTLGYGRDDTDRRDAITVLKNGNTAIGINNWENDADAGSIRFKVLGTGTVAKFSNGTQTCEVTPATAGAITCSSDENLKKEIQSLVLNDSLDSINALRPVSYFWKDDIGNINPQQGFIAQEVQNIFPELVRTDSEGKLSVSYIGLIPSIVASIQKISSDVESISRNLKTENIIVTYTLCFDDVCLTKEQVLKLLENANMDPASLSGQ